MTNMVGKDLLAMLRRKAEKLDGYTPKMKEVDKDNSMPHSQTYIRYFGSWSNACELAGLKPNKSTPHEDRAYNPKFDLRADANER